MNSFYPVVLSLFIFGCTKNSGANHSPIHVETIRSLEDRVGRLEKQLGEIQDKVPVWDSVAEGVTQILKKLENGLPQAGPAKPSPEKVYRVPVKNEPFIGNKNALVTIVKAYDFYCGFCDKARPTMDSLLQKYPKDLKVVFKEFVIHPDTASEPALAACAAHKEGKFLAMYDRIWQDGIRSRTRLTKNDLLEIANDLGMKRSNVKKHMETKCLDEIANDQKELAKLGVRGTPAFFVNGRYLVGAQPVEVFSSLVDEELRKAKSLVSNGIKRKHVYDHIMKDAATSL